MRVVRKTLFNWHAWLGLHIFVILFAIFATGTVLTFIDEIEAGLSAPMRMADPAPGKIASFGTVFEAVRQTDEAFQPLWIERSHASWIADRVWVKYPDSWRQAMVWVDPATATYQGGASYSVFRGIVRGFHDSLLTGKAIGGMAISAFGPPILFFVMSGLISYRRFWRGYLRVPSRAQGPRAFWGGVHRLCGLWALPFLIVMGVTGTIYLASFIGVLEMKTPAPAPVSARTTALPAGFDGARLDAAAEVARETIPNFDITYVKLPVSPSDPIVFRGQSDAILVNSDANVVVIDPSDLSVLGAHTAQDLDTASWVISANERFHYGSWGGFASRVAWLIFGAIGTGLCLAGSLITAARVMHQPQMAGKGALRRIWTSMSFLKWGLVLFFLGLLAIGILRSGSF